MFLNKIFNFNFFKENVRKSKGLLAFLLGIIPIINIIYLIILLTTSNNNLLTFDLLSFLTYAGMIFIPLALSLTLFGFIFKKKSVDFVMSKPINRKTLFRTNTIGGILILIIFMLINTAIFGLFGLLFSNLTIPISLLIDYFIFWLISYIFMFITINLAVVLSGNLIASLVVFAIIVLIVPYLNAMNYLANDYYGENNYIVCDNEECKPTNYYCYNSEECESHLLDNEYTLYYGKLFNYNFIAPLSAMNETSYYNSISLVKMIFLSIIYAIIGYFVFKKRKMENNETSFKNNFAHYLVKGITLIPVCFLTFAIVIEAGIIGWLIAIAGIIIYSIVYDLITRKEIYKPVKSTLLSLILFLIFTGVYYLEFEILDSREEVITNVEKISYQGMDITDQSLINQIIKSALEKEYSEVSNSYNFIFSNKNGQYSVIVDVNQNQDTVLRDMLAQFNAEKIKNFNINQINYIEYNGTSIPVTKKLKELIKNNIDKIDEFDLSSLDDEELINLYSYQHHQYESVVIPLKLNEELYQEILKYQNELFINHEKEKNREVYYNLHAYKTELFTEEDYYVFDYVINSNEEAFINYLKNDNEISIDSDIIYIKAYDFKDYTITIGNITSFKQEFDRYKENLKDSEEYQSLLNEYHNMMNTGAYD